MAATICNRCTTGEMVSLMISDKKPQNLTAQGASRRGLLRGLFHAVPTVDQENRQAIRPPFASPEHLFLVACDGCGKCQAACPYALIQIQQQKAVLELDYAACDFCGKCAASCPTKALNLAFRADTELRPVILENCVQKQGQTCERCQKICPQQAISSRLMIDHEKCNGCGECKIACYVSAIKLDRTLRR